MHRETLHRPVAVRDQIIFTSALKLVKISIKHLKVEISPHATNAADMVALLHCEEKNDKALHRDRHKNELPLEVFFFYIRFTWPMTLQFEQIFSSHPHVQCHYAVFNETWTFTTANRMRSGTRTILSITGYFLIEDINYKKKKKVVNFCSLLW